MTFSKRRFSIRATRWIGSRRLRCAQFRHRLLAGRLQPADRQSFKQRREAAASLGPRQTNHLHAILRAVCARRLGVQNRAVLTGVKVTPAPLRLMVVQSAKRAAFGARPRLARCVGEVNMHFARLLLQLNRLHPPRTLNAQYRRVQLVILHGEYFARLDRSNACYPLQSRNSHY
jgi:hypothetical protein